jgi:type IX secretion system PorP/SprF family membrane protein
MSLFFMNVCLLILKIIRYFTPKFWNNQTLLMKKIYISLIFCVLSFTLFAQQEAQFTQYMFNNMLINPGYAGINKRICLTTLYREQWTGFKSQYYVGNDHNTDPVSIKTNPETFVVSVDAPVRVLHGGVGVSIYSDKLGFENNLGFKLGYAYHVGIVNGTLGIGLQVGFLNKKIDFSKFNPIDANDPILAAQDKKSTFMTDISFGLFYNIPGKAYVGLSASQLIQSKMKFDIPDLNSTLKRHYYLTGAYHWAIPGAPDWELSPYVLIKTDFSSAQYDITAMAKWRNMIWAGISYRVQDAVAIIVGAYPFNQSTMNPALQQIRIGYSYDITTSALGKSGRSSGSHEIMLGYCFKITMTPKITSYKDTRFL